MSDSFFTVDDLLFEAFQDVGFVGDKWGHKGSGLLFTTGERILLFKRSRSVEEPGTWGIAGGAIPEDDGKFMDALVSANKEAAEEMGTLPPHRIIGKYLFKDGSFTFETFIARVVNEFTPNLNWESDDYVWTGFDGLKKYRLHPGVAKLLKHINPFKKNLRESKTPLYQTDIQVGGVPIKVWVSDDPDEQKDGLTGVHDLPEGIGMLFVYPKTKTLSFWMKDTPLPLDIAFIVDGIIFEIKKMKPNSTESIVSSKPADSALEMEAGWFEKNGVHSGAEVKKCF